MRTSADIQGGRWHGTMGVPAGTDVSRFNRSDLDDSFCYRQHCSFSVRLLAGIGTDCKAVLVL